MPTKTRTMVSFGETAETFDDHPTEATPVTATQPVGAQGGHVLRGRYRLDEILAQRAEGQTWRAFDVLLARPVLVHLLPADRPNDATLAAAKRAAIASDSRVLRVLDATIPPEPQAWDDSWIGPFVVCEYAPGQTLGELLATSPLSTLEAGWIAREIADALAGMHARGLAHERLSPGTVMVTATGNVKIVGFLLEPSGEQVRDPEGSDVRALGGLLYAMLVGHWPGRASSGLPAAPTDSAGRVLSPREIQPRVPASLDQICGRILNPDANAGLRTAADISAALTGVLGTADASLDLEQRVRGAIPAAAEPAHRTLVQPVPPVASRRSPLAPQPTFPETAPLQTNHGRSEATSPGFETLVPRSSADAEAASANLSPIPEEAARGRLEGTPGFETLVPRSSAGTRWRRVLTPLVMIAAVGALIVLTLQLNPATESSDEPAPATAAQQWPVVTAKDFDPEGNGEEHPNEVTRAWDGNPATSWTTMNYFEGDIGNKTGVGLVFDLGEVRQVSRVELELDGNGTSLEVRVPNSDSVTAAPLGSVNQWRTVGTATAAPAETSVALDQPVRTRFVLIYLTELPPAAGQFTGGIAEARFWG